jgi:hypothetical protein
MTRQPQSRTRGGRCFRLGAIGYDIAGADGLIRLDAERFGLPPHGQCCRKIGIRTAKDQQRTIRNNCDFIDPAR